MFSFSSQLKFLFLVLLNFILPSMPLLYVFVWFFVVSTTLWKGKSTFCPSRTSPEKCSCSKSNLRRIVDLAGLNCWSILLNILTAKKSSHLPSIDRLALRYHLLCGIIYLLTGVYFFFYHNQAYFSRLIGSLFSFIFSLCLIFRPTMRIVQK